MLLPPTVLKLQHIAMVVVSFKDVLIMLQSIRGFNSSMRLPFVLWLLSKTLMEIMWVEISPSFWVRKLISNQSRLFNTFSIWTIVGLVMPLFANFKAMSVLFQFKSSARMLLRRFVWIPSIWLDPDWHVIAVHSCRWAWYSENYDWRTSEPQSTRKVIAWLVRQLLCSSASFSFLMFLALIGGIRPLWTMLNLLNELCSSRAFVPSSRSSVILLTANAFKTSCNARFRLQNIVPSVVTINLPTCPSPTKVWAQATRPVAISSKAFQAAFPMCILAISTSTVPINRKQVSLKPILFPRVLMAMYCRAPPTTTRVSALTMGLTVACWIPSVIRTRDLRLAATGCKSEVYNSQSNLVSSRESSQSWTYHHFNILGCTHLLCYHTTIYLRFMFLLAICHVWSGAPNLHVRCILLAYPDPLFVFMLSVLSFHLQTHLY